MEAAGTYALGASEDMVYSDIAGASAKVAVSLTSLGFTAAGAATTVARTLYGRTRMRRPHSQTTAANLSIVPLSSITGKFLDGETVTQAVSGATAVVLTDGLFDLVIRSIVGSPDDTNVWTGGTSGATGTPSAAPSTYTARPNRENIVGTDFRTLLALSHYVYDGDTNLNVAVAAGAYTAGGEPNNAKTISVTNTSEAAYPKVIARWANLLDIGRAVQGDFILEVSAWHFSGIACVIFEATDGTTTQSQTIAARSASTDGHMLFRATFAASSFAQDATVTCNFRAYPVVGNAAAVRDSSTGTWPSLDLCPLKLIADAANTYRTYAYVDGVGAGTPAVSTNPATAKLTPYATMTAAASAIKTYNNASRGRNNCNGDEIRMMAGNHLFGRGSLAANSTDGAGVPVTITKDESAARSAVVFNGFNATNREAFLQTRIYDVTLSESNIIFGGATTQVIYQDVTLAGSSDSAVGSGIGITAWQNATSTGFSGPFVGSSLTRSWLHRNTSATISTGSSQIYKESRCMIGARLTGGSGVTAQFWNNGTAGITCNNVIMDGCVGTYMGGLFINVGSAGLDLAFVNCVAEMVGASGEPLIDLEGIDLTNVLLLHNTTAGQRINAENDWTNNVNKTCVNFFAVGNASKFLAHKDDEYQDTSTHSILIGQWPRTYGVGWVGNIENDNSFPPRLPGLNDAYGATPRDFVNDNSITGSNDGAGDYHLQSTSTYRSRVPSAFECVTLDAEGNARSGTEAAGAYRYT